MGCHGTKVSPDAPEESMAEPGQGLHGMVVVFLEGFVAGVGAKGLKPLAAVGF